MKKIYANVMIQNESTILPHVYNYWKNYPVDKWIFYDDCSTDNSLKILKKFKNIKVVKNRIKKFKSAPLNQIHGLCQLFKISKGDIIFLLDSDDEFKKNKIVEINKIFKRNNKINFVQDTPLETLHKKKKILRKKRHFFSIWPSFYPTSCIVFRRNLFVNFLKVIEKNKFSNLEIDARLSIYAYIINQFYITNKSLTIYNYDENGISSKYKKFSKFWWKKRNEAFEYMISLMKKFNTKSRLGPDYYLTKIINLFV